MAQQQYGDNVDLQFLPGGSLIFVTTDEPSAVVSYEFVAFIEEDEPPLEGLIIPVAMHHYTKNIGSR
jgi:hypothetical protein